MNDRCAYAQAHPVNSAAGTIEPYRTISHVGGGELLVVILAVDR